MKPGIAESEVEQKLYVEVMRAGYEEHRVVLRTRSSENDGSEWWRHFNLYVATEGLESKTCLALKMLNCVPLDKTDSPESYRSLKFWLNQCNSRHQCIAPELPVLPKRVLKIQPDRINLHLSREDERSRYATVSHRWGSFDEHFVLTLENLEALNQEIPWSQLPKTAQDAIEICRELGIEYLWIDSLCIIQRHQPDWQDQSGKMGGVYGQSYLNIAAMDSVDSNGGCFRTTGSDQRYPAHEIPDHPTLRIQQQPHFTHFDFGANYPTTDRSPPLLRRCWVLQERLLSPRCVYYGKDELLWECKAGADCFCGGTNVIAQFKGFHHHSMTEKGDPLPFVWMRITERYSCLDLTHDSDRAIALSGIAQEAAASGRGGKYLAGMWWKNLAHQLLWEVVSNHRRPSEYLAPSWSWLSVFGRINYGYIRMDFHGHGARFDVEIADAAVVASKPDGTGKIESAYLLLIGKTVDMEVELVRAPEGGRPEMKLKCGGPHIVFLNFRPDYTMETKEAAAIKKVVLLYWGYVVGDETFMVLREVPCGGQVAYERLGLLKANDRWTQLFKSRSKKRAGMRVV
ncbi:hypothetical protein H2200_000107 [Cladophialophora chaetospira]|uniref:Heterokaryon incompatibility domain-containing protein n=1 Tax=Cladophialophora chaetospira TaxID=386627 RepID=A0AA39CNW8_9EURO|nr:hypothetical protein H2200_000107 [Cladophialophora chaetospira]